LHFSVTLIAAMVEVDELLAVVGSLQLEIEQRVRVVDLSGEAKAAGYASAGAWLRAGGRLPGTLAALRGGEISHEMAAAIADAVKPLPAETDVAGTEQNKSSTSATERDSHTRPDEIAPARTHHNPNRTHRPKPIHPHQT
jgi:hypothetical protein